MERSSARRFFGALAGAGIVCAGALVTRDARAWCRTTTDDQFVPTAPHPCADTGLPLAWVSRCAGYDVQRDGSPAQKTAGSPDGSTLDPAGGIVARAVSDWARAGCPADPAPRGAAHAS